MAPPDWLTARPDGVTLTIKAVPRSRSTRVVGMQNGAVRVQIAAAPHHGQSNNALCAYLAEAAGVRSSAVRVRRGSSGARKLIEIDGDTAAITKALVGFVATALPGADAPS